MLLLLLFSCGKGQQKTAVLNNDENAIAAKMSSIIENSRKNDTIHYEQIPVQIVVLEDLENNEDVWFAQNILFHDFFLKIRTCGFSYLNIKQNNYIDSVWNIINYFVDERSTQIKIFYNTSQKDYYIIFPDYTEDGDNISIYHLSKESKFTYIGTKNVNLQQWEYYLSQNNGEARFIMNNFSYKLYKLESKVHYVLSSSKGENIQYLDANYIIEYPNDSIQKKSIYKIRKFEKCLTKKN